MRLASIFQPSRDNSLSLFQAVHGVSEPLRDAVRVTARDLRVARIIIEAADRRFRDAYLAKLKTKMDETAFAKGCEQGRKLKLEEPVALCFEKEGVNINR